MLRKLLCSLTCVCLCTGFSALGARGHIAVPAAGDVSAFDMALQAALCEAAIWNASDKVTRDSLLFRKAELLSLAGESGRAYETLCRIQRFGLSEEQRAELARRKLICTWEAGLMDEFRALLEETGLERDVSEPLRHRSGDIAMLLSVIPGAGLAYAGNWGAAGKCFAAGAASITLGVGAFLSGLYLSAFLGGGMLLYTIIPASTSRAVSETEAFNLEALREYYRPTAL